MRPTRTTALVAPLCALAAMACEPGGGATSTPATPKIPFDCVLGFTDTAGSFRAAADGDKAELHLGFQGFLFFGVRLSAAGDAPSSVTATYSVQIGSSAPSGSSQPGVGLRPSGGTATSDEVQVFLNSSNIGEYTNQRAVVAVRLEDATRVCTARATLLLVDEDPCIHTGDTPICPDGTRAP